MRYKAKAKCYEDLGLSYVKAEICDTLLSGFAEDFDADAKMRLKGSSEEDKDFLMESVTTFLTKYGSQIWDDDRQSLPRKNNIMHLLANKALSVRKGPAAKDSLERDDDTLSSEHGDEIATNNASNMVDDESTVSVACKRKAESESSEEGLTPKRAKITHSEEEQAEISVTICEGHSRPNLFGYMLKYTTILVGVTGMPYAKVADTASCLDPETFLDTVLNLWGLELTDVHVIYFYTTLDHGGQAILMSENYVQSHDIMLKILEGWWLERESTADRHRYVLNIKIERK